MAGKAVGRPLLVPPDRTFEGNRFAQEHQRQAFDWLLAADAVEEVAAEATDAPVDSKEGVAT